VFGKGQQGGELEIDWFTPVVIDNRLAYPDVAKLHALLDQVILSETDKHRYPLVIIARSIEQDYISEFVGWCNKNKHLYKDGVPAIIAMNTNMGGSIGTSEMQDLAVMLNAPFITDINDLDKVDLRGNTCTLRLGSTRSHLTELTGTDEQRIEDQAKLIEKTLAEFSFSDRFSLRARINERRIRNLRSEMVTIHVGGETNSEIKERIDRYEDVVKAVRSGLENGILPGGGIALMRATAQAVKRYRQWNLPQGMDPLVAQKEKEPYILAVVNMALTPRKQLFNGTLLDWSGLVNGTTPAVPESYLDQPHILDLASGRVDTPENLGVYDTAYASITALKGGLQTAKLLANTDTLILGDKIHAVKVP
jgi:chaperonin GroEL